MIDHFNFLAPIYDAVIQPKPPEKILELLKIQPGSRLLDAGGGTGRISQYLTGPDNPVIILDTSFKMLEKSQEKEPLQQVNGASETLPFASDSFDRILMVDALHHVQHQSRSVLELWRVLKPGGRLLIEEPDIRKFAVKLVAVAEKLALMRSHFLSGEKILNLFEAIPAQVQLLREDHYVWVVAEKPGSEDQTES